MNVMRSLGIALAALVMLVGGWAAKQFVAPSGMCLRAADWHHQVGDPIPVGARQQWVVGRLDILGECDLPAPDDVRWSSSDSTVLEVDSIGMVTARRTGRARITASIRLARTSQESVGIPPVRRIVLTPADTTFVIGDTVSFRAKALGENDVQLSVVTLSLELHPDTRCIGPTEGGCRRTMWMLYRLRPSDPPPPPDQARVVAQAADSAWLVASVIGRRDSIRIRAIPSRQR